MIERKRPPVAKLERVPAQLYAKAGGPQDEVEGSGLEAGGQAGFGD